MFKKPFLLILVLLAGLLLTSQAYAVNLPAPDCTPGTGNCLYFDDAIVYSLALLQFQQDLADGVTPGKPLPGDPFYVDSSSGKIKDDLVILGTGTGQENDNQDVIPPTGAGPELAHVDNAYQSASGLQSLFAMLPSGDYEDPPEDKGGDPDFVNDNARRPFTKLPNPLGIDIDLDGADGSFDANLPLWDVDRVELLDFLDDGDFVVYYNLNETKATEGLANGQDMLAYAEVWLTDTSDPNDPNNNRHYFFSGNDLVLGQSWAQDENTAILPNSDPNLTDPNNPDFTDPNKNDYWAYVHGEICVDNNTGAVLWLGTCDSADPNFLDPNQIANIAANGEDLIQNLGTPNAAFALTIPELNKDIYDPNISWDVMSVDIRLGYVDDGLDRAFARVTNVLSEEGAGLTVIKNGPDLPGGFHV